MLVAPEMTLTELRNRFVGLRVKQVNAPFREEEIAAVIEEYGFTFARFASGEQHNLEMLAQDYVSLSGAELHVELSAQPSASQTPTVPAPQRPVPPLPAPTPAPLKQAPLDNEGMVRALLERQQLEEHNLQLQLPVELPLVQFYQILRSSFKENDQLVEHVLRWCGERVSDAQLRELFEQGLRQLFDELNQPSK